jgi:glycosyltransferase involved in cell wall biosynthesis
MLSYQTPRVVVAWHRLPFYAARCIRALAATGMEVWALATPGPLSLDTLRSETSVPVRVIDPQSRTTWAQLGLPVPAAFCHTGWAYPAFNSLAAETRRAGSRVIMMVDNSPQRSLRQRVGEFVFRLSIRPRVDAVVVPGIAARTLMRSYGMPCSQIHDGMYAADPCIFTPGSACASRPHDFLFVGKMIPRKGVSELAAACISLARRGKRLSVMAIGDGPLREVLGAAGIPTAPFMPAHEVASYMQRARCLVLPSHMDHWGVVVHEAALCGCGLLLSDAVGAHLDLLGPRNGLLVPAKSPDRLADAMEAILAWDAGRWDDCSAASIEVARTRSPQLWADTIQRLSTAPLDAVVKPLPDGRGSVTE